ncbi:MAG TPA: alpha/beta hydrolase [Candidatus Binataceae bacterium]|nr:alpha/beta hydrolase [Candidatus Binataceae bacterium]
MPKIKAGTINLSYEIFGSGDPLLLIMGFGMPGVAWTPVLPFLGGFKCIYYDNRGTGNSDRPEGAYSISVMAQDAAALLDALGIEKAKVYGISMGGMIAQELALQYPDRVEKLVLGCTTAGGSTARMAPFEVLEKLIASVRLMASKPEEALDVLIPLLYPPEFVANHPELKPLMLAVSQMVPGTPPETADRTVAGLIQFNTYERLPQIKCPTLIVHGEKDLLIPAENARIMAARLGRAEVMMIPDAGHGYWAADPIGIHQRVSAWLKG